MSVSVEGLFNNEISQHQVGCLFVMLEFYCHHDFFDRWLSRRISHPLLTESCCPHMLSSLPTGLSRHHRSSHKPVRVSTLIGAPVSVGKQRFARKSLSKLIQTLSLGASLFSCVIGASSSVYAQSGNDNGGGELLNSRTDLSNVAPQFVDWVLREDMTQQQIDSLLRTDVCAGHYFAPEELLQATADDNPPLEAIADRTELINGTTYLLEGGVKAIQGRRSIEADRVVIDQTTGQAEAEGGVVYREPELRIIADKGEINNQNNTAEFNEVNLLLYANQMRADAVRLKRHANNSLHLNETTITACPPGQTPDWQIESESVDIREGQLWGVAKNPVFKFKGVPVFYLPFMTFPTSNERLSGFLFPTVGFSDNGGLDVSLPYYFNLAPNYDLIVNPRVINDRGPILETQFRHLSKQFESELDLAYLEDDPGVDGRDTDSLVEAGIIEPGEDNPFINRDRWLVGLYQKGGASAGAPVSWYSSIDFTRVSDQNYFRDLNNTAIDVSSETHLLRNGTVGYRTNNWNFKLAATSYQTLVFDIFEPYQELPRINVDGNYEWGDFSLNAKHEVVSFEHSDEFDFRDRNIIVGDRARAEYDFLWRNQAQYGFFTPGVHLKHTRFDLNGDNLSDGVDTSQDYTVLQGSLDTGLFFEREGRLAGEGYLQTFEPRLFYFYSDFADQSELLRLTDDNQNVDFDSADLSFDYNQLFRTSRFSGGDRIDDDHRLSVGLTTRFINNDSGQEVFRASVGQIFYFEDRRVFLSSSREEITPNSEIAGEFSAALSNVLTWSSDIIYDEEEQLMSEGRTSLRYLDDDYRLINVGFNFNRRNDRIEADGRTVETSTRQSDLSVVLPVNKKVSVIFRNLHDFTFDRELDTFGGFEYNSCCYRARFIWRRWIDSDLAEVIDEEDLDFKSGVFFDIQFKGLGSGQGKFAKLLSEAIPGYSTRELRIAPTP